MARRLRRRSVGRRGGRVHRAAVRVAAAGDHRHHVDRALEHQPAAAAPARARGARHLPALVDGRQPGQGRLRRDRRRRGAGLHRVALPRHRQGEAARVLHREPARAEPSRRAAAGALGADRDQPRRRRPRAGARRRGCRRRIVDAIAEHHGTHVLTYFHNRAVDANGGRAVDDGAVPLPGTEGAQPGGRRADAGRRGRGGQPHHRRSDARYAARAWSSRSSKSHVRSGELDSTQLTLGDIKLVAAEFQRVLDTFHHRRVDYPGFDFRAKSGRGPLRVVGS